MRRGRAVGAAHRSSTSTWKANQRLAQQLARTPAEPHKTLGEQHTEWCSHQINMAKHPEHNCREFENELRAKRGAPPL